MSVILSVSRYLSQEEPTSKQFVLAHVTEGRQGAELWVRWEPGARMRSFSSAAPQAARALVTGWWHGLHQRQAVVCVPRNCRGKILSLCRAPRY